jgi:hypothetical protein
MQSNYRVSRIRPPSRSRSRSKKPQTIEEEEDIDFSPPPSDADQPLPPPPPDAPELPPLKRSDSPEQNLDLPYQPTKALRMKERNFDSLVSTKKSFRNTKEWTDEIKGVSTVSSLAKLFLRQKKELNDKRRGENINEIDTDYRLKRKRDLNATIRSCKETVNNLISLPTYFSSSDIHSLIFKLQNFIIELNNNILNINNEIQLNRPILYDDADLSAEEVASSKSGGKRKRRRTMKKRRR